MRAPSQGLVAETSRRSPPGPQEAAPRAALAPQGAQDALASQGGLGALRTLARRLLIEPTSSGPIQFLRYGFVGGAAFAVDFSLFWGLTSKAGLHYLVANLVGFAGGLLTNYALSVAWVFRQEKASSTPRQFLLFALVGVVGVGLNEMILWTLINEAHLHPVVSKLMGTIGVYFWNFFARRRLLS